TTAASALSALAFCRGRHDAVHAWSTSTSLPLEAPPTQGARVSVDFDGALQVPAPRGEAAVEVRSGSAPAGGKRGLMAAVEDAAPPSSGTAQRRVSFDASSPPPPPTPEVVVQDLAGFDQSIMSGLRYIVVQPSPSHPAVLFPEASEEAFEDMGTPAARDIPEVTGFVRARVDEFHEKIEKKKAEAAKEEALVGVEDDDHDHDVAPPPRRRHPARAKTVVVYFTSLRGVRRTFEDGRAVRAILRCHRVRVDERDVSMHAAFRAELGDLLGGGGGGPPLPRVFVDGRHDLGGADDVRALHEAGELARALAGCEQARAAAGAPCAACGDARFLLCEACHGSCKIFAGDEGSLAVAGVFRRCPDCNENGLIRCPVCCY
ncbi:uncharacterized protein At3g28850-like, partial [Oryza brachyantha]|uniref:uncharacterized protein At3g28850-like n=1 Tax=Oryza brachyantha TaxID=4533 RepID=UPI001ADC6121